MPSAGNATPRSRSGPPPSSVDHARFASAIALSLVRGISASAYRDVVATHGSAEDALATVSPVERQECERRAEQALTDAERTGMRVLVVGEDGYPPALLDLRDPPPVLFALGNVKALYEAAVAIVGTRTPSSSGERVAWRMAGAVVRAGGHVVSGMARGIDASAHRGALDAEGVTVAVLGGGADRVYPVVHRALYDAILERGVVVSEALPGSHPHAGAFPRRNRIIAALSRAVLVVEAGERSGALHTARHAQETGRELGVVPGPIDAPQCVGSNDLLRDGATFIGSPQDLLLLAGLAATASAHPQRAQRDDAERQSSSATSDPREAVIVAALRSGAGTLAELSQHTRLPSRELTAALTALELADVIWTDHAGSVRLNR